jgi:hypothetical protein
VGHSESQLVHSPFHLGKKAQLSGGPSHVSIVDKHPHRDTQHMHVHSPGPVLWGEVEPSDKKRQGAQLVRQNAWAGALVLPLPSSSTGPCAPKAQDSRSQ